MNFEDEEYVRVYSRKTITYKLLGWEGRTVLWHLMLEATQAGVVEIGDGDAAQAVALLTDLPLEVVSAGLPRLASQGVTERHGTSLVITRFVEAQTAKRTDRVRAAEYRGRVRAGLASRVTQCDEPSPNVTRRDESSHGVTGVTKRSESSLLSRSLSRSLSPDQILPEAADPRPDRSARAQAPISSAAAAADEFEEPSEAPSGTHRAARVVTAEATRLPRNREEALALPIRARSELVTSGKVAAQWLEPQRWPEVLAIEAELAQAEGRKPLPLVSYDRDTGVRAVVELYAAGYTPGDLRRVARQVPTESWWRSGEGRKGLASLTPEVVRRGLCATAGDVRAREMLARVKADQGRAGEAPSASITPIGDLLGKLAGGAT